MISFFHATCYQPLYNGLIALISLLPGLDLGVVVVLFTIIVKLILFPLSQKASSTQARMKEIEPELSAIKLKYKDDTRLQAEKTMEVYKKNKVNPFSSVLVLLIQLPIIFSLYYVFLKSGLPGINEGLIYSFTPRPEVVNMNFLGLIDIGSKSVVLAALAGVTSFLQALYAMPAPGPVKENPTFQDDLARGMSMQMKYVLPVIIFLVSLSISGAVALYWTTSNLFTVAQEFYLKSKRKKELLVS
jgi:YidC/Oxa1 family membrane protein insertase